MILCYRNKWPHIILSRTHWIHKNRNCLKLINNTSFWNNFNCNYSEVFYIWIHGTMEATESSCSFIQHNVSRRYKQMYRVKWCLYKRFLLYILEVILLFLTLSQYNYFDFSKLDIFPWYYLSSELPVSTIVRNWKIWFSSGNRLFHFLFLFYYVLVFS